MTTRDHARPATEPREARPPTSRPETHETVRAAVGSDAPGARQPLPERLHAARDRKGVDLYRAERDTKIRAHYLAALERGDYRELPGAVYTKGFLRNYAIYLGLDPDDVLLQWRAERGESAVPAATISTPRPLMAPRRGLTFSPGVLVAAMLTIAVLAFFVYLGVQLFRWAKPPTIAVEQPAAAVLDVQDGTSSYTFSGTSIPGATIEITASGRSQPYRVSADADGAWTVDVDLSRGRNEFVITAKDPETGKSADQPVQRVITVPFPVIEAPTLAIDSPTDGAVFENGAIPVTGRSTNAVSVTVGATFLGPESSSAGASPIPAPSPSPSPAASTGAEASPSPAVTVPPQTVTPADDGTFSVPLELTTGRWSITITAASQEGKTTALTRSVTISYKGVNLVVAIHGGRAWLKVWVDGQVDPRVGAAGRVVGDGGTLTFTGKTSVEVRTGNSGATFFTLNGQSLGALGKSGAPETWLFQPPDPPVSTGRR